jgi:hypothetical protein
MSRTLQLDFDIPAHRMADAIKAVRLVALHGLPPWEDAQTVLLRAKSLSREDGLTALAASKCSDRMRQDLTRHFDEGIPLRELVQASGITHQAYYKAIGRLKETFLSSGDSIPEGWRRAVVVVPEKVAAQVDELQHQALNGMLK